MEASLRKIYMQVELPLSRLFSQQKCDCKRGEMCAGYRYEVRCTYHDGGEYCHGVLQRRPARETEGKPSSSALAPVGGGVAKNRSTKNGKMPSSTAKDTRVEFVWVLTRETGYELDGFHAPMEPSRDVITTIPDGPAAREAAIKKLQETAGEMLSLIHI